MDMPTVENKAMSLLVVAECVVPRLSIGCETLDFGDCFLHYPVKRTLQLINDAKLPAKFTVEAQDAAGAALAEFKTVPSDGLVPARGMRF
jgi:hydrocephalus-inducing protein